MVTSVSPLKILPVRGAIEARWLARGFGRIAGVDEVGRGPLAGPVVAAAVILPPGFDSDGIADSKKLSQPKRLLLAERILAHCEVGIASVPAPVIDEMNILQASLLAMRRAVAALPHPPDCALIDGKNLPSGLGCPGEAIVKGDQLVVAIGAASIVAKVARDRLMAIAEQDFPGYGFASSAGYPTLLHRVALPRLGLTPLHRRSFAPCRALLGE